MKLLKKGDISITTIIVAAVALIVLIVLVAIFTGKIQLFGSGYDSATDSAKDQVCNAVHSGSTERGTCCAGGANINEIGKWIDCSETQGCCWS